MGGFDSGPERAGVAAAATLIPTLLLVHAMAAVVHLAPGKSPGAAVVSWTVVVVGVVHGCVRWRSGPPVWVWSLAPFAAGSWLVAVCGAFAPAFAVFACSTAQGVAQARLARHLPDSICGAFSRHRWRAIAWSMLAVLAVIQTGRLATHEADPEVAWWVTTKHPDWTDHQCTPAYVYAADLHRQGEPNIYDPAHYPDFGPGTAPHPTVENLGPHVECSYQYPPTFLLLPALGLLATKDFYVLRPIWLAVQGLGFLAAATGLCLWIGGARGRAALWLLPAVWVSVPMLQNLQLGQFHVSAMALAVAGMLAFERRWPGLGGALLAAAVAAKIYPAVLMLLLLARRRFREFGATLAWLAGLGVLGLVAFGASPFEAFFVHHLPRLLDGSAFGSPFWDSETVELMMSIKIGVNGIPDLLKLLGVPQIGEGFGPWLGRGLVFGILVLLWRAGRRVPSRSQSAILWLALLNLVVLQGPAAFIDYAPATSVWLLSLVSIEMAANRAFAVALALCWMQLATLIGSFPLPDYPSTSQFAATSLAVAACVLGLNSWSAVRATRETTPEEPR